MSSRPTRFILFGSSQIGSDVLRVLAANPRCVVDHVFTYDLPLDRLYGFDPVAEIAAGLGVPVVNKKSSDAILAKVADLEPDYILSAYYRKILPAQLLGRARVDAINIHPSDLPNYRGPTPTGWALVHGERRIGVAIHRMDQHIDAGDILAKSFVPIDDEDTGFSLHKKAMTEGVRLFEKLLPDLIERRYTREPQVGIGSYYGPIAGLGNSVRWHESAELTARKVRCFTKPYTGIRAQLLNKTLIIYKARTVNGSDRLLQGPGYIVGVDGDRITVSCADGYLELLDFEWAPAMREKERPIYLRKGNRFDP